MVLPLKTALWIAVGMLAGALVWSKYEMRSVPAASILLADIPKSIGQWQCVKDEVSQSYGTEVSTLIRDYKATDGTEAQVTLQGTYTRLGGLRDWSLARTTTGWTISDETTKAVAMGGDQDQAVLRLQRITKDDRVLCAVSWYTSPTHQAANLTGAETRAWRDRLVGHKSPWLSLYVVVDATGKQDAAKHEKAAVALAKGIAPRLREIAAKAQP